MLAVISISLGLGITYTALSISPFVEGGSIFTCSIIFAFSAVLTSSSLLSVPNETIKLPASIMLLQIFIGLGFMLFVLFYVSGTTKDTSKPTNEKDKAQATVSNIAAPLIEKSEEDTETKKVEFTGKTSESIEDVPEVTLATALFHLFMCIAAIYVSMLLSNWGSPNAIAVTFSYFSTKWLGFIMSTASLYVALLLFIWSLIAPIVCPGRDFS